MSPRQKTNQEDQPVPTDETTPAPAEEPTTTPAPAEEPAETEGEDSEHARLERLADLSPAQLRHLAGVRLQSAEVAYFGAGSAVAKREAAAELVAARADWRNSRG